MHDEAIWLDSPHRRVYTFASGYDYAELKVTGFRHEDEHKLFENYFTK